MEQESEQRTRDKQQSTGNATTSGREGDTVAERPRPPVHKGDDIAERLIGAAESARRLLPALERDAASKHVGRQLWRAVTGGGSNYEEARGAESAPDFVHKVRIATKELREALYWTRVVQRSSWVRAGTTDGLVSELDQLIAILVASARTAKANAARRAKVETARTATVETAGRAKVETARTAKANAARTKNK